MLQPYQEQAGVYIYDSFQYPENEEVFMTAVVAQINDEQYWRDIPLLIKQPEPTGAQAINLTPSDLVAIGGELTEEPWKEIQELPNANQTQKEAFDIILEQIKNFPEFTTEPSNPYTTYKYDWEATSGQTEFVCEYNPEQVWVAINDITLDSSEYTATDGHIITLNTPAHMGDTVKVFTVIESPETLEDEIIIRNAQGDIVNSLSLDKKEANEIAHGPLLRIVNTIDDSLEIKNDEKSINILEDKVINSQLEDTTEEYIGLLDEASDTYKIITEEVEDISNVTPIKEPDEEEQEKFNENLLKMSTPFNQWYGIPIINIGPRKAPTKDSYILNVNTKNNWNLELTNIVDNGLDNNRLYIDKQIPPGKKFLAGFFMLYGQFSIFLRIEGEDRIYQKTVRYNYDTIPQAISYGVDNEFIKTICGYIWDIYYWKQDTNFNHNLPAPTPQWPNSPNVHVFDFNEYNLSGNTIYTIQEYGNVAYGGSGSIAKPAEFYHLQPQSENITPSFPGIHPWHFLYNSYVDKFFCRNKLKDGDFALIWYQWLFYYPTGIKNLVSDNIYNNYINYDFTNFNLIVDFNGRHYEEHVVFPEKLWAQFAVRYKKDPGLLIFSFTDFYGSFYEELTFEIGDDLEFELMSMFAQYNREEKEYQRHFQGLCGMILVYEEYPTNEDLHNNYKSVKPYLNQYAPLEKDQ